MEDAYGMEGKMRQVAGLLREGSDIPSSSLVFIKSRSLAEPISEDASMAGPISKLWILPPSALLIDSIAAHRP